MKYKISFSGDRTYIRIKVFEVITGEIEKVFAENAIKNAKKKK